jgi:hypothetical protein
MRVRSTLRTIDDLEARSKRYEVADVTTPALKERVCLGRWPTGPATGKVGFLKQIRIEGAQVLAYVAREAARQADQRALTFGAVAE